MALQFQGRRANSAQGQHCLKLWNRHIGHSDIAYQSHIYKLLTLSPGIHKFFYAKGLRIRIPRIPVTARCMVVGERPVHKIQIKHIQAKIRKALFARLHYLAVAVIPNLGGNE